MRGKIAGFVLLIAFGASLAPAADEMRALYDKALKDFYAERYDEAESAFATVYRLKPDAPYAPDAAFKAGEAAFRQEHWSAAIHHFAHYRRAYPLGPAAEEAKERLDQIKGKAPDAVDDLPLPKVQATWPRLAAAWIEQLPAVDEADVERYLGSLAALGYNAVIVPAVQLPGAPSLFRREKAGPGLRYKSDAAPLSAERLPRLVTLAHKHGLKLVALLPVRGLAFGLTAEQLDRRWDAAARETVVDPAHVDLFAEGALDRLAQLARDAARAGPDAIWFGPDLTFAPDEGVSPGALAEVKNAQPHAADPPAILAGLPLDSGGRLRQGNAAAPYTAFCEARAKRVLAALAAMSKAAKEAHPSCLLGAVVSDDAVADPIAALRDAAFDLDGLAQLPWDALAMEVDPRAFALSRSLTRPQAYASMAAVSAQLRRTARRPERAVVALRTQPAGGARPLPRWEIEETLGQLLSAGPFGAAFNPAPGAPVAPLLAAQPETEAGR